MSRGWCLISALLLLSLSAVQRGGSEGKGLCVVKFHSAASEAFLNGREVKVDNFADELILQLHSSKVLEDIVKVTRGDNSLGRFLQVDSLLTVHDRSFCEGFWNLCNSNVEIHYYLVGRISDDMSNIMSVDVEIYEAYKTASDMDRDPLLVRFHVEASQAEAFAHKTSLVRYLVDQVVLQVEANLDERIRVLILPLTFFGHDESVEHLGGMIASLIGNHLSVSQRIRVIMFDSMANAGWRRRPADFRKWTLPQLGRLEAAKYLVDGSFFKLGAAFGIEASHIDVETGHSVLSKSVMIKSLSGPAFYEEVGRLGDEMRRAIELDFDTKHDKMTTTVAVVAVPPYPATDENRLISREIASTVARMLKALPAEGESRLVVVTDAGKEGKFLEEETENSVMGQDLNTQYLWVVRCERPARDLNVRFEFSDVKNSQRSYAPVQRDTVRLSNLDSTIHAMVRAMLSNGRLRKAASAQSDSLALSGVRLRPPENTFAVIPVPPYPNTVQNRAICEDIANIVMTKLRVVQQMTKGKIAVTRTEEMFDDIFEMKHFEADSIARELGVRFLWLIDYEELGHERYITLRLVSATNPFERALFRNFHLDHIDDLNQAVGDTVREILIEWWPDRNSSGRTPLEPGKCSDVSKEMRKSSYLTRSSSLRVRGILMGLRDDSKEVFLGNPYRYAIEVAGIYHFEICQTPFQAELSATYDFGKKSSGKLVYGRYVTGLLRWNLCWDFFGFFRDMRLYLGLGATLVNIVRVKDSALGPVVPGYTATAGFEIPFSRYLFLDLNFQHLHALKSIPATADFPEGFPTSNGLGCGIGFRLK